MNGVPLLSQGRVVSSLERVSVAGGNHVREPSLAEMKNSLDGAISHIHRAGMLISRRSNWAHPALVDEMRDVTVELDAAIREIQVWVLEGRLRDGATRSRDEGSIESEPPSARTLVRGSGTDMGKLARLATTPRAAARHRAAPALNVKHSPKVRPR